MYLKELDEWQTLRSWSLFYFVPQEKRLTRRSPWEWKNMRDSILHVEINRMPTSIIAILGLKTSQGGNLHEGNVILPFAFPTYPPHSSPPPS